MAYKFKLTDKYIAFANDVASGMEQAIAYQKNIATKKISKATANVSASQIMAKSQVRNLVEELIKKRTAIAIAETERHIAKEFSGILLLTEELDIWHCSVIQGLVVVEEVVRGYDVEETLDGAGNVVKRTRKPVFKRISRPPNIREKQYSISELYKRRGAYAPLKMLGAFGSVNDQGELENIERVVLLASGEKIPLL